MSFYSRLLREGYTEFDSADDFRAACLDYFNWCDETPLEEENLFAYKGSVTRAMANKPRVFTLSGLCTHVGIPRSRLRAYRERGGEWEDAVQMIDQILETQKFEYAAVNLMNASLISRDLGLTEKTETKLVESKPVEQVDPATVANLTHPDDPYEWNEPRPLYSREQLDAGIPFTPAPHDPK